MDELQKARETIDECDRTIAEAFEKRFCAVQEVIRFKISHGLPVLDSGREKEVIEKGTGLIQDEAIKPYYARLLQTVMDLSKEYQEEIKQKK